MLRPASRFAVIAAFTITALVATTDACAQNKVVFQVSDPDTAKWNLALSNARNLQSALGADQVDIEIVAYGPGIGGLKADSPVAARINDAVAAHIRVFACENTMAAQNLHHADMLPAIGFVPAGVVEIVQKQQQGYAYLRP